MRKSTKMEHCNQCIQQNYPLKFRSWCVLTCSVIKSVLRNFVKLTGKHLCQSLFFNKVASLRPKNTFYYRKPLDDCFCKSNKNPAFIAKSKSLLGKNSKTKRTRKVVAMCYYPPRNCLLKVNNRNIRASSKKCPSLTIKTPKHCE